MDDFDRLLYEGAAQLPVDAAPALEPPKPWKGPLDRVCWGLVLITITLNFLGLDWILPAIGTVLLWLGLRPLRRENGGFRFAYVCATLYAVLRFATMLTLATPLDQWLAEVISMEWSTYTETVPFHTVVRIGILQTVLTLAALGLWQGLKAVFRSAGQKPHAGAAGGVAIVVFLLFPLACIGLDGWLSAGVVLVIYVVLLCNLYKLSRSLDEAGYALKPAPVRVSDGKAAACWLGALALGILVLPLCFARLPVPAEPVESEATGDQTELQEHLAELGFPEEVLAELAPEDLARLEGAYGLTAKNWPPVREENQAGMPLVSLFEVPVSDPEYGYRMVYLARFVWEDVGRIPYYTEGIAVSADFHDTFAWLTYLDGHLAWTEDGTAYTAPLDLQVREWKYYTADFSLPKHPDGGQVYGYVFWSGVPHTPGVPMYYNAAITVAHRQIPWLYPYALPSDGALRDTAMEHISVSWHTFYHMYLLTCAQEGEYGMYAAD